MNKNILIESFKSNFKVLPNKPANVLKRIQGVLSDFKSNRNGRIYPRELWENVLSSDYVKEMIDSHGLVGELDHPEERLEISLQNVSHVINDMWIENDQVIGVIDILPTPNGKIVNELLDYGTDIGISSRGSGSVGPNNTVDPDYQFITFDFVARPSCEAARLNTILEGVQIELDNNSDAKVNAILESYKESVKEEDESELRYNLNPDTHKLNEYGDDAYYSQQREEHLEKELKELKRKYRDIFGEFYSLAWSMSNIIGWDSPDSRKIEKLSEEIENFKDLAKKYKNGYIGESVILEAAMSDQDIYKTVLGWYKEQIEAGNMTLNQCYQLLSDKAKVSLNKMVDQSKIKESIISDAIDKLLTESVKKNYICIRPVKHPNIGTLVDIDEVVSEDNTKVPSEELNRYYKEYNGPIYTVKINGEPRVNFSNFNDAEEYSLDRMEWDNGKFTVEGPDGEQIINESVSLKEGAETITEANGVRTGIKSYFRNTPERQREALNNKIFKDEDGNEIISDSYSLFILKNSGLTEPGEENLNKTINKFANEVKELSNDIENWESIDEFKSGRESKDDDVYTPGVGNSTSNQIDFIDGYGLQTKYLDKAKSILGKNTEIGIAYRGISASGTPVAIFKNNKGELGMVLPTRKY